MWIEIKIQNLFETGWQYTRGGDGRAEDDNQCGWLLHPAWEVLLWSYRKADHAVSDERAGKTDIPCYREEVDQ